MISFSQYKRLPWLSIVSIFGIVLLLCFQGYWLYNGYRDTYTKFVDTAKAALQEACNQEQELQKAVVSNSFKHIAASSIRGVKVIRTDSLSNIRILQDTTIQSPSAIVMNVESIKGANLERLDSLFRQALAEKDLYVDFVLEATLMNDNTVRTIGRHKKSEIKIEANNIQLTWFKTGEAGPEWMDIGMNRRMSMSINMNEEHIAAYLQFTPLTIFRQMLGTLLASVLLFGVIFYCLLAQLRVIRRQKTAARMKNDFIANFTHELKTPIAVVYAALDNIERNPAQTETAVEAGKTQLKRLSDSVEKILSLSVEEQGRIELHREEAAMSDWLASLIEPFRLKAGKDATFELTVEPFDAKARIDKAHFANALNNIIDNAIKYSGEQVHIIITCTQTLQGLRIAICDNGTGIAEENLKRIFDRFYRVKDTAAKVKGFGLGLNYAKTIIELHGGVISVESTLEKGSRFIVDV